jgi:hypothetical protein
VLPYTDNSSVAEPHHFYAAPALALGENFDAAPAAPAPAPTLLYSKANFFLFSMKLNTNKNFRQDLRMNN